MPDRPLTAVTEGFDVLRELLDGTPVSRKTSTHVLDDVRLEFPPEQRPELWIGAVNQRALRAAGAKADGVLLSVLAGPAYVRWASEQIAAGAAERRPTIAGSRQEPPTSAGRGGAVRVTAFVLAAVDEDAAVARDAVREAVGFFLRAEAHTALVGRSAHGAEIRERLAGLGPDDEFVVADAWVDEFAAAGDAETVAERLQGLLDAGASSLGLWLFPPERRGEQLRVVAGDVLARLVT